MNNFLRSLIIAEFERQHELTNTKTNDSIANKLNLLHGIEEKLKTN